MIYTCLSNGAVDHAGSRAIPGQVVMIYENPDWYIAPPRVVYGKAENGGTYFGCEMPTLSDVQQSLHKAGIAYPDMEDYTGRIVWDKESMSPDIDEPWDKVNLPVRWELARAEYDGATDAEIRYPLWPNASNAYHKHLWKLIRQACPKAAIGRYGYPLLGRELTDLTMFGTLKNIEFPWINLHGKSHGWTLDHVVRARVWVRKFGTNSSRKPCIQHDPDTRDIEADRKYRERWKHLWESGEFDLVIWKDVQKPSIRAATERYIKEEFPV